MDGGWQRHQIRRLDLIIAFLFAIAALVARWPFIRSGETLLHSDEAIVGLMAQDIEAGRRFPVYFYGQRYMGALEAYVIAALRPWFTNPITSLRVGPTCFFAVLTVLQYLMLTRWLGRVGGLVGATSLLAASPMFVQWSISARGGYIEVLVWGCLLWWAYTEWFVAPAPVGHRPVRQVVLGALIGSGMWINPTIAVFVVPMLAHALLGAPLRLARASQPSARYLGILDERLGKLPLALPCLVLLAVMALNCVWAVWVEDARVHHAILLNLLPHQIALLLLVLAGGAAVLWVGCHHHLVAWLRARMIAAGPLILGFLLGNMPSAFYVFQKSLSGEPLEDTLPLGLRPIWRTGETLEYLFRGAPVLLGADPAPFLTLVRVGRSYVTTPLDPMAAHGLMIVNWLVGVGLFAAVALLARSYRGELAAPLRLEPGAHSPVAFLMLALVSMLSLYVMGGCTVDFTTIRYLVPLWAVIPGLLGALAEAAQWRWLNRTTVAVLWLAWSAGQVALYAQLGPPHPLRGLAKWLTQSDLEFALAEPLDAHLLSFLTRQQPRIGEFQSFWPRLAHYRAQLDPESVMHYVVHAIDRDWTTDWTRPGFPGNPPPETSRFLWPALQEVLAQHPERVLSRQALPDGYELWTLSRPLHELQPAMVAH